MPTLPRFLLFLAFSLMASAVRAVDAPPTPAERRFDVMEFAIDGNSVLPAGSIEQAVYPFLGTGKTVQDIERAREALERAYQDAGYMTVLVELPEQRITEGLVRLQVVEGKVDRLKVSGSKYHLPSHLREEVPSLAANTVPYFPDVQQDLAAAGRSPDRQVTPLLRPGRNPGTVEVELKVDDRLPLHGSVELNNKQSPDTEANRVEAAVRYDNLWQRRHSIGLRWIASPTKRDEVDVLVGTYAFPVGTEGAQATFYAMNSDSNLVTAQELGVSGQSTNFGFRYSAPLPSRSVLFLHGLSAGLDWKDLKESSGLLGSDTMNRPLRYAPLSMQYFATLGGEQGSWRFGATTVLGLRGLSDKVINCGGVQLDQFACRRSGARSNFALMRLDAQHERKVFGGWGLLARLDAQFASQPLVSSEQFAAGGADSVRGYLDGERMGDQGLRLRFEFDTPGWLVGSEGEWSARGQLFYDWADLKVIEPNPGQEARFTIAGAGVGLRLAHGRHLKLNADWALALMAGERTKKNDGRLHVRLAYEF